MSYTETSSEGFFSRLSSAFGGIVTGFILIAISSVLLYWNEGNYVRTAQGLAEGRGSVVDISESKVDPAHEGKLVHLSGVTRAGAELKDEMFGVKASALRLRREVQFYQWEEKKESKKRKKLGGSQETVTTYTYARTWTDSPIDSSNFKEKGHDNPPASDVAEATFEAQDATLGAFKLSSSVLENLAQYEALPLSGVALPAEQRQLKVTGTSLYSGKDPTSPAVGDFKIRYEVVKPGPISVVAKQVGDGLESYLTKGNTKILLVQSGTKSAAEMFVGAEQSNSTLTWALRGVGWLLMCIGFSLLFGPVTVLADILPFFGDLVGIGVGLFGFMIGSSISLLVISIGWVVARPLLGIMMLLGAAAALGFAFKMGRNKRG
jgi:hypothetical protein